MEQDTACSSPRASSWLPAPQEEPDEFNGAPQDAERTTVQDMQESIPAEGPGIANWEPEAASTDVTDSAHESPMAGAQPPAFPSGNPQDSLRKPEDAAQPWSFLPDLDLSVRRRAVSTNGWMEADEAADSQDSMGALPTASESGRAPSRPPLHGVNDAGVTSRKSSDNPRAGPWKRSGVSMSGSRPDKPKRPMSFSRLGKPNSYSMTGFFSGGSNTEGSERRRSSMFGGTDTPHDRGSFSAKARKSLTRSLSQAAMVLHNAAVGDDNGLEDKWAQLDAEQDEVEGAFISTSVVPEGNVKPNFQMGKRSFLTLLWYYWQGLLFSLVIAAVGYAVVGAMSRVTWHTTIQDPDDPDRVTFQVNHGVMAWMLLLQCFASLNFYSLSLYVCVNKSWRIPKPILLTFAVTTSLALIVCGVWWHTAFPYWYYYLDLILIAAVYVPSMTAVGWCMAGPDASMHLRIEDAAFVAILETLVAVATLVYCTFLMPFFLLQRNAWIQMLWLCVVHPLYFEVMTGYVVRKALQRNRALGRTDVTYFLSIVHAAIHPVALTTSLQASIEPIKILIVTVTLYSINKLVWRSTIMQRDLFVERLFRGWNYQYPAKERAELARMVTVSVVTEMILENASIFISPFMMWCMWRSPIFMAVVPNTFFNNGGSYPVKVLLLLIGVMLSMTLLFDVLFFVLNYWVVQQMPIIYTWRRIKAAKGYYLGFLVYGFATMGVMFLFCTMMVLPRAGFCNSPDYCSCKLKTYETVCRGAYISTLADYLV